jgi:hypothetical protein
VRATAEAGGRYIFANPLFLKPCSAAVFLPFLAKEFPHLVENYHRRYDNRAFLPKAYAKHISALMAKLRRKYGIVNAYERYDRAGHAGAEQTSQLTLF